MSLACGDPGDVRPSVDIALCRTVQPHGEHRAVELKPHCVIATRGDLSDIRPVADIALPGCVQSHGDHSIVGRKPYRVIAARRNLGDAPPVVDIALPVGIFTHSDHSTVDLESYGVEAACRNHGSAFGHKVSSDEVAASYNDVGRGSVDVANAAHVTSPFDKAIALFSLGHQVD